MARSIEIGGTEVEPAGIDEYDETESVKLFGPPGSGKTTNATARVALLLRDHDYTINDVTWLTYRKSLAMDTLRRLADAGVVTESQLTNPTEGATRYIGTAHAVANRAVSGAGEPIDWRDKLRFCQSVNVKFKKSRPWEQTPGEQLFRVFTYARKNLLDPTDHDDLRKIPVYHDLQEGWTGSVPALYEDWLQYKDENNKIGFWEMLAAPLREQVTPDKSILVVDEYHDAYPLLAKLAEYWAGDAEIVMVPGDPHQVVNNYDGADPAFYHRLPYPEIELPTAWERPPFEHWYVARSVLANAHTPPEMDIRNRGTFEVVRSPPFQRDAEEWHVPDPPEKYGPAWFVNEHGKNTMLLARTTFQLDGLARALERAGILFETPSSSDVPGWQAPANDDMSDRVALYNALQKLTHLSPDAFDSGGTGLGEYTDTNAANPEKIRLEAKEAAILVDHAESRYLDVTRAEMTSRAESWLNAEEAITAATLDEYVTTEFWGTYTQSSRSTGYLIKTGKATNSRFGERGIQAVQNALRANKYPVEGGLDTKLYTIHASKGNQAETVAIWDGITSRTSEQIRRSEAERDNEYRTWYVALTRSTKRLYVLKGGFEFTSDFLPRGRELLELAARGYEAGENRGGGS